MRDPIPKLRRYLPLRMRGSFYWADAGVLSQFNNTERNVHTEVMEVLPLGDRLGACLLRIRPFKPHRKDEGVWISKERYEALLRVVGAAEEVLARVPSKRTSDLPLMKALDNYNIAVGRTPHAGK